MVVGSALLPKRQMATPGDGHCNNSESYHDRAHVAFWLVNNYAGAVLNVFFDFLILYIFQHPLHPDTEHLPYHYVQLLF